MDKDFEKKVKQKRIRTIAVVVVVLAAMVYLLAGTKVEKADYTESLHNEIQTAETLYEESKNNVGNQKGQYTEAVLMQFVKDIDAAKAVLNNENREYSETKQAYETLKEQVSTFKQAQNASDLTEAGNGSAADDSQVTVSDGEITVSMEIRCDNLAKDLSKLRDKALEAYVPADGIILSLPEVNVTNGETVYDVLDRICRDKGIHMESVYTPTYGANYIEGINYLYEFDAGEQSGWMYKVNGEFPQYGCSTYVLKDGDAITWAYTCDMGNDLGQRFEGND